ncbi:TadA family conjugal transfer-associated ATPase [Myceligenerans cantabricum]
MPRDPVPRDPALLDPALLDSVRARIARGGMDSADAVREAVRDSGRVLGSTALAALDREARAELLGAGPLQPLLETPDVTDVLVNGPDDVWIDRGRGLERVDVRLGTTADLRALAVRLAAIGGQRLDDAQPSVDARLPDGTRLHAVLEPLAPAGAAVSLRVLRTRAFSLDELVAGGALPAAWVGMLRALVERRANILISGGTGTGKTTLLAALLSLAGGGERIVTVEEARELMTNHPHVMPLVTRRSNVEGAGGIDLADLVRDALRMRPDRIVLGECRGPEVRDVLMAMNTGHDGGLATLHANAVAVVPARLEALAALAGMPRDAVAAQAAGALDVVLHLRRARGVRFLAEVGVVGREEGGELTVRRAAWWDGRRAHEVDPAAWQDLTGRFGPW